MGLPRWKSFYPEWSLGIRVIRFISIYTYGSYTAIIQTTWCTVHPLVGLQYYRLQETRGFVTFVV